MGRGRMRNLVGVAAVSLAAAGACSRINPHWDESGGSGSGADGASGSGTSDDGGAGSGDGHTGSGGSGGDDGSGADDGATGGTSDGAPGCGDGNGPIPGSLCHGPPTYVDVEGAWAIAAGDVDGDGHADIVVGATSTWVFRGDGSGSFSPLQLPGISQPRDATIDDLDLDGVDDFVVVGTAAGETLAVYLGDGMGGHGDAAVHDVGMQLTGVVTADLDGDGYRGLYATNGPGNEVAALVHQGSGTYGDPWSIAVGGNPNDLAAGDLDGDGDPDLAVANFEDGTVSVLINDGSGGLREDGVYASDPGPVNQQPNAMAIADCDGDGNMDVVTANELTSEVVVMLGDGSGAITFGAAYPVGDAPFDVAVGDLDGDGRTDVVSSNNGGESLGALLADAAGAYVVTSIALDHPPRHVAVADFNEDGADDWAVTFDADDQIAFAISEL